MLLGAAAAGVVLAGAHRARPPARRMPGPPERAAPPRRAVAVEALGRGLLGAMRRPPADPASARRVGAMAATSVAAMAASVAISPLAVAVAGAGVVAARRLHARRRQRARQARLEAGLADVVDLVALAAGAGCNVSLALALTARRAQGPLGKELDRLVDEVHRGRRLADALDDLASRVGEAVRPLTAALVATERYGAPLGPALERVGEEVRRRQQRRAEEAARRVPVALCFPLVFCILPAFALLTVAPLVAGALRALAL